MGKVKPDGVKSRGLKGEHRKGDVQDELYFEVLLNSLSSTSLVSISSLSPFCPLLLFFSPSFLSHLLVFSLILLFSSVHKTRS